MKKACFAILLFLSATLFSSAYMPPAKAQGQAIIMPNHTGYLDNTTIPITYHVVGEVSNVGTANLELLNVTASFYAQDNALIGSSSSYVFLDVLLPSRKAPFEVVWVGVSAKQIQNYSLNLKFNDYVLEKPLALQILENTVYKDEAGFTKVNGTIRNLGRSNATAVRVATTFYDTQGGVIGVAQGYTSPSTIAPDNTQSFELELSHKINNFSNYNLAAESVEYDSIEAGITIDFGATYTMSASVTLILLSSGLRSSIAQMRFSNDNITFLDWELYAAFKMWTLEGGDGAKTVYAQFMTDLGSVSYYYDTIVLDTTAPEITITLPNNGSRIESPTLTVTWTGFDATSGIDSYSIKLDNGSWIDIKTNATQTYTSLTVGEHLVSIIATDKAGLSKQTSITFSVITSPFAQTPIILAVTSSTIAITITAYLIKRRRSRMHKRARLKTKRQ